MVNITLLFPLIIFLICSEPYCSFAGFSVLEGKHSYTDTEKLIVTHVWDSSFTFLLL